MNGEFTSATVRIFWRIIVDACRGEIGIRKQLSLWTRLGGASQWTRQAWEEYPMRYVRGRFQSHSCPVNENPLYGGNDPSTLWVDNDSIYFAGGFLKITDKGLGWDISQWGYDPSVFSSLSTPEQTQLREYLNSIVSGSVSNCDPVSGPAAGEQFCRFDSAIVYWGENVRLEATFASKSHTCDNTLLCYPQKDKTSDFGNLVLSERGAPENRQMIWKIADGGSNQAIYESNSFGINELGVEQFHHLTVGQDRDSDGSFIRFEPMVDAVPLAWVSSDIVKDGYPFPLGLHDIFIGLEPATAPGEPNNLFQGRVKRMVLDPNASCQVCP